MIALAARGERKGPDVPRRRWSRFRHRADPACRGIVIPHMALLCIAMAGLAVDLPLVAPDSGATSIMLLEAIVWPLFGVVLLNDVAHRRLDIVIAGWRLFPELFVYLACCGIAAILAAGIMGSSDTIGKIKNMLPGILLCMLMARTLYTTRQIVGVVVIFLLGTAVNAALGIVQFVTGSFYFVPQIANNMWKTDLQGNVLSNTTNGLTNTPNNLAALLVPGLVLAITLLISPELRRRPALALLLLPLIAVLSLGLYLTFSKGGLIWAVLGIAVALAPAPRWRLTLGILAVVVGVIAILAIASLKSASDGAVAVDTVTARVLLWEATEGAIADSVYAWSFGSSTSMVQYANSTHAQWGLPVSHNTWIDQIVFFGLPALALYVIFWLSALRRMSAAQAATQSLNGTLLRGIVGGLIALAGILFFEPRADGVFQTGQIFVLMTLGLCLTRQVWSDERCPARLRSVNWGRRCA